MANFVVGQPTYNLLRQILKNREGDGQFCGRSVNIGHEVKHSSLQEEKITHLKYKIPFLETQIVPHLLYWA